ncbi:MAG: tetratricopeptide repeat protein [Nitrospirae bacterium]|nr:tetratricopeptide repeat protein [Nitrospirota bacterium]
MDRASPFGFFCLLSLVMYIKFRIHDTKKIHDAGYTIHDKENHTACIMDRGSCIVSRASCIMYLAALFSAVLAMKTKETAFTLPVVITLYEFMFFTDSRFTVHGSRTKRRILYLIPLLLTMLIIPFSRIDIDQPSGNLISDVDEATRALTATSRWDYLITEFRVLVTYLRLLLLPINQNLDYDYPIYHSFLNPEVLLSFLFLLSIFGFGVYLLYRSRVTMHDARYMIHDEQSTMHASRITHHALRFIAFGIFWFFITLSVESSIIPTRDAIFEHRLYLPSIGFIIAFSSLLFYVSQQSGSATVQQNDSAAVNSTYSPVQIFSGSRVTRHALRVTCFAVVVLLSIAAYQRNIVWQDKITLWEDVARKSPDKARGHGNLGKAYLDKGILDKALEHLRLSLRLNPTNARAHNNIGVAYGLQGLSDKAGEHYRLASEIDPEYSESHFNLGVIYLGKEDMDNARREFETALRLNPDHYQAKKFLGYIYQTHR